MNKYQEAVISTADGYVGYLEKKSDAQLEDFTANAGAKNFTKFGKWYGMNGEPWCAIFVSFCANKAGIPTTIIPKFASCGSEGVPFFKRVNRWNPRNGYTPKPADIIFFTDDGVKPVHVGIVSKFASGMVHTIEGNTSAKKDKDGKELLIVNGGGVARKSYPLTSAYILGYGNPDYAWEDKAVIVQKMGLEAPDRWWARIDPDEYATDFYAKWAAALKTA